MRKPRKDKGLLRRLPPNAKDLSHMEWKDPWFHDAYAIVSFENPGVSEETLKHLVNEKIIRWREMEKRGEQK